jgi:hypothetical protein
MKHWVIVGVAAAAITTAATPAALAAPPKVTIEVLSSRADLVTGGDALVRITVPRAGDARRLKVKLGAKSVTRKFAKRSNGEVEGLLTGIGDGRQTLTAEVPKRYGARITLVGHPNGGPLISGPQLTPWVCQATAVDRQCNQAASYELKAVTGSGFVAYDPAAPPSGIKDTTTTDGRTVPFVVRVETGYQDRDQYKFATLYDPKQPWKPWAPQAGWNRRIVFTHGGSCGTDRASGTAPDVLNQELLGKGFLMASTALDNLGHNCNPVIIAESELMARERIVEQYGPVQATLGTGCSGGSIAQLMLAHAYPGFYDGITVQCTFADLFTTGKHAISGHLFKNFFGLGTIADGQVYTVADHAAVSGSPLASTDDLVFDGAFWPYIDGSKGCAGLAADVPRWSPENPSGIRCGVLDHNIDIFGKGANGYAAIPFDNVGVQYGLKALTAGTLTPAKFVDLNARIGGLDTTSLAYAPQRVAADQQALDIAYRAGYMAVGNTLDQTPILEGRGPNETTAHATYPTLALNARLDKQFGTHANHVVWQGPTPLLGSPTFANRMVLEMDRWVAAIHKDARKLAKAKKIRDDKPVDLIDHCELADGTSQPGLSCPAAVRFYDSPSMVAGESPRNDILKCQLKPLRRDAYTATFTDTEWATMTQTFPGGVCDWSKPGVGQANTVPWLTFAGGPGGKPLGAAPLSKALRIR